MIPLFKVYMAPEAGDVVRETLYSGYVTQGPKVDEFEACIQKVLGAPRTPLATSSCTAALDLALHLSEVGPGSEVITTPINCTAGANMIANRGATIVWADVDPVTGNIDPDDVDRKITSRTAAIMAVDWGGRLCDYGKLKDVSHGVPIIEDAAHAFLASSKHEEPWLFRGDYICWSFGPIKHLNCGGNGGALLTPPEQTERARLLRWYGLDRRSSKSFRCDQSITEAGFRYNMNDIEAAIGLANLRHVNEVVNNHVANAYWYSTTFNKLSTVTVPYLDYYGAYWLYTILVSDPSAFISFMAERGIECSPVHAINTKHPAFQRVAKNPNDTLPGATYFAAHEVAIPVHWGLSFADVLTVRGAVLDWARKDGT